MISKKRGLWSSHADFSVSFRWAPFEAYGALLDLWRQRPHDGPPGSPWAPESLSPHAPLSEALMPSLVTVLHFCISLWRTYFLLISYSHSHGHFLVLATQKCLRPDPRMPCYGMNCFSVLLFVPGPLEILAGNNKNYLHHVLFPLSD